jgi:hypothetical protein
MKVIVALALLLLITFMVCMVVAAARGWYSSRHPWELDEDEGLSGRCAFFAVKPGHEPRRLSPWRSPEDLDFSAIWADDRAAAESKITHMNLGRRKQIG